MEMWEAFIRGSGLCDKLPDDQLVRSSIINEIEKALDTLPPIEAEVLNLYFGLHHERALTLEEIGIRFSRTSERIRQIKDKGIRRLRHGSSCKKLRDSLTWIW